MILDFDTYVSEKYIIKPTDKPEAASNKTYFNDLEAWIMEYKTRRKELDNIYMTYTSREDLRRKLQAFQRKLSKGDQRIVRRLQTQSNPKDPKAFQFLNPLFDLYSQISAKKRQIKVKEMDLEKQEETIQDRQKSSAGDEDLKASYAEDISRTEEKIRGINDDIKKIYQEMADLERQIRLKLKVMTDEFRRKKAIMDAQLRQDTSP